jgi:hypothetical protein
MRSLWLLILGDVAALVAFGLLGVASHERSVSVEIIARSIVPFVVAWLFVGGGFGMFGNDAQKGRVDPGWFLMAWLISGVSAMIARSIIFDRELITAFFVIGLAGYGLFLASWRVVYYRIVRRRDPSSGTSTGPPIKEGTNG